MTNPTAKYNPQKLQMDLIQTLKVNLEAQEQRLVEE